MPRLIHNPFFCTAVAITVTVLLIYTAFLPNNYPLLNGFFIGVLWAQIVDIWRLHRQMKKLRFDDHVSKLKEWEI